MMPVDELIRVKEVVAVSIEVIRKRSASVDLVGMVASVSDTSFSSLVKIACN